MELSACPEARASSHDYNVPELRKKSGSYSINCSSGFTPAQTGSLFSLHSPARLSSACRRGKQFNYTLR